MKMLSVQFSCIKYSTLKGFETDQDLTAGYTFSANKRHAYG